uniref:CUT domain-containing protein n=1 Tax=Plectus sambesii TaxID=2011161 RepID=A0A914XMB7_9BILA
MLSSAAPDSNSRCIQSRSGNLSRSPVAPVSMSGIVDSAEFRCQVPEPTYHTLNGRMSPSSGAIVCQPLSTPGYASSSYTTLTPLQPLPPISTVTPCEKFVSQVTARQSNSPGPIGDSGGRSNGGSNGGFAPFFQSNNSLNFPLSGIQAAYNVNIKYEYDMKPNEAMHMHHVETTGNGMSMASSSPLSTAAPLTPTQYGSSLPPVSCAMQQQQQQQQQLISHNAPPQHAMFHGHGAAQAPYTSNYSSQAQVIELRAPKQEPKLFSSGNGFDAYGATVDSVLMSTTGNGGSINDVNGMGSPASSQTPTHHQQTSGGGSSRKKSANNHQADTGGDLEELNTKDLAQRISAELKRYSIPQAIFAQRVLCRSQGTLSDLLRNPKPWSKLKSGRETFRRMFKWLQEPEFQRIWGRALEGRSCAAGPLRVRLTATARRRRLSERRERDAAHGAGERKGSESVEGRSRIGNAARVAQRLAHCLLMEAVTQACMTTANKRRYVAPVCRSSPCVTRRLIRPRLGDRFLRLVLLQGDEVVARKHRVLFH